MDLCVHMQMCLHIIRPISLNWLALNHWPCMPRDDGHDQPRWINVPVYPSGSSDRLDAWCFRLASMSFLAWDSSTGSHINKGMIDFTTTTEEGYISVIVDTGK